MLCDTALETKGQLGGKAICRVGGLVDAALMFHIDIFLFKNLCPENVL